ncbi:MAG TPA: cyclic nucleotide-binding domain-containing protein [Actinomycetota bacterium]|nr:cyclic nucleotide-binding domain-containing protein [Actinomycetota bacterium]
MEERISHSLVKALRSVPDFASLSDHELLDIVGASTNLAWPAGSTIFEKGSPSEALYIVLSGRVRISDVVNGERIDVATVGPDASFGELSLLLQTTHSKEAVAEEDTELMIVPKEWFQGLLQAKTDLAEHFHRRLAERLPVLDEVQVDHPS